MNLTPLSGALLAVAVFLAATVVWNLTRTKRKVAGSKGPKRFPRSNNRSTPYGRPRPRSNNGTFRALAIWGTAVILIGWVALSLANPGQGPDSSHDAQAQETAPPQEPAKNSVPVYTASLSPPPPPGTPSPPLNLPFLEPPPEAAAPRPAIADVGTKIQVKTAPGPLKVAGRANIQEAFELISTPGSSPSPPLSTFAPSDQVIDPDNPGSLGHGALAMAPSVSRMEPIGLSLAPKDEPRATKVLEPAQERPRLVPQPKDNPVQVASTPRANPGGSLSAPPSSGSKPPPLTNPDSTGAITYTVLLGSFGKAENAERLRLRMVEAGLPVSVSQVKSTDDKVWYRVMSGNFNTENQANAYSRELRDKNLTDQTFIFKNK